MERFLNTQLLFLDGDNQISGDRNPDLGANRILTGAVKRFDPQMLFNPFEKEFDLPAVFIQQSNGLGTQGKVVGQENQKAFVFRIVNSNSAQGSGIILLRIEVGKGDSLIADDVAYYGIRFMAGKAVNQIAFTTAVIGFLLFLFLIWQWYGQSQYGPPPGSSADNPPPRIGDIIGGIIFMGIFFPKICLTILAMMAVFAISAISTMVALFSVGPKQCKLAWIPLCISISACALIWLIHNLQHILQ